MSAQFSARSFARSFVVNRTRKTVLAARGRVLRSILRQAIGTMFHRIPGAYVFLFTFPRKVAITNLFVFQPIDILWLDASGRVVDLRERFPSFALHVAPRAVASVVIEVPAGMIAHSRTRCGDLLACSGVTFRRSPRLSRQ